MRPNWIKVEITPEMVEQAIWRRICIDEIRGLETQHFDSEFRWIGELGELVFETYLEQNGVPYQVDRQIGQPDKYDFIVNGRRIDVKTARCKYDMDNMSCRYKFLIAHQQLKKDMDVFVHIQVNVDFQYALIIGWITKQELRRFKIRRTENYANPCIAIPFKSLYPVKELWQND